MAIGTYSIQSSDDYPNSVTSATLINYTVGKFRRHWLTDEFPSSTLNVDYTSINYPVVRYADVLLMYAECYHECEDDLPTLSSGYDKYSALNQVRTRGGSVTTLTSANIANISALLNYNQVSDFYSSTTLADVTDKSKLNIEAQSSYYADYPDDFTLLLRLERARELGGEGLRKFDLIRWGSYYHTMKAANAHYETTLSTETGVTYYSYPAAENIEVKYTLYAIPYTELINNPNLTPNPAN